MSRAIENYICASEDRSHYNNEFFLYNYYYRTPMLIPRYNCTNYHPILRPPINQRPAQNITIIQQGISQEELNNITDTIANKIEQVIGNIDVDTSIDEIYGGSASDMIGD